MTHDLVLTPALARLVADPALAAIVGTAIYESGERTFVVPSLEWTLIVETPEAEIYDRVQVQFDVFTRSKDTMLAALRRIDRLLVHRVQWTLGTLQIRSLKLDIRTNPTEGGVHSGSIDVEFKPVRER